jgi:HTH-type transcriptional regulator, quorum sensing regulator NprR
VKIGTKIRYYRNTKKMTQDDLAQGIISIPYLSKIENNLIVPSKDVIELLCERLQINPISTENKEVEDLLDKLGETLLRNQKEESKQLYNQLEELQDYIEDPATAMLHQVYKVRYFTLNANFDAAFETYESLKEDYEHLDQTVRYLFHKHAGNLHYVMSNFQESKVALHEAIKSLPLGMKNYDEEKADTLYLTALTYSKIGSDASAIQHANACLQFYQSTYHFKKCADIHLILGVSYRRIKNIDEAIVHYEHANNISDKINYDFLVGKIEHNLGYLNSLKGNHEKAITHYKKSLHMKNDDAVGKLNTYLSLLIEYHKIGDSEKTAYYVEKTEELAKGVNPETIKAQLYGLKIYQYLLSDRHDELEKLLRTTALPFFKKNNQFLYGTYSQLLAEHYEAKGRYKLAVHYYKATLSIHKKF